MTEEERFMKEAIRQAKKARALKEVPIGCVIVSDGKIIAFGFILPITTSSILDWTRAPAHIWQGSSVTYMVHPSSLQSPSFLLAFLIAFSSAWERVFLSVFLRLYPLEAEGFNHKVKITKGILQEECSSMLSEFFRELRQEKKMKKEEKS